MAPAAKRGGARPGYIPPGGVALSVSEQELLAEITGRRRPGPVAGAVLSAEEKAVGLEDQVQRAWRRLVYAVRATRDQDAALAMRRLHTALEALHGSVL